MVLLPPSPLCCFFGSTWNFRWASPIPRLCVITGHGVAASNNFFLHRQGVRNVAIVNHILTKTFRVGRVDLSKKIGGVKKGLLSQGLPKSHRNLQSSQGSVRKRIWACQQRFVSLGCLPKSHRTLPSLSRVSVDKGSVCAKSIKFMPKAVEERGQRIEDNPGGRKRIYFVPSTAKSHSKVVNHRVSVSKKIWQPKKAFRQCLWSKKRGGGFY